MVTIKGFEFIPIRAVAVFIVTFVLTLLNNLPANILPTWTEAYAAVRLALLLAITTAWTKVEDNNTETLIPVPPPPTETQ